MERSSANGLLVIERILRDREGIWEQIIEERELRGLAGQVLASSAASLEVDGLVLRASNGFDLALAPRPVPPPVHPPRPTGGSSMPLLYIWILLFGFVGTQLGWTLRPFFGDPGQPFSLFRQINGTFYGDILATIGHLLHG